MLVVGNDVVGQASTAWEGDLFRLELWDRPLSAEFVRELHHGDGPQSAQTGLLADYDFSRLAKFSDRQSFLPDLFWATRSSGGIEPSKLVLDGRSWLASKGSIAGAAAAMQKTNQFAIRVVCRPAQGAESDGRIVGIWGRKGEMDLRIRQDGTTLIFWFLNPLSVTRSDLVWHIRGVFEAGRMRDIVFSYDGSNAFLYLDGERKNATYRLGPGIAMARLFHSVGTSEMDGYNDVYYFLVFFPAGILAELAARRMSPSAFKSLWFLAAAFVAPAALVEILLISVSGRPISFFYVTLSVVLAIAGCAWINIGSRIQGPFTHPTNELSAHR